MNLLVIQTLSFKVARSSDRHQGALAVMNSWIIMQGFIMVPADAGEQQRC